ncbi:hypothetical protein ACQ4PT_030087 [Festuca glaucescens]
MTPTRTDSHGGTTDPTAEPKVTEDPSGHTDTGAATEKPTSSKPSTPPPDIGKGPALSPIPSTATANKAPQPKSKKLTARPQAGTEQSSVSGEQSMTLHVSRATTIAARQMAPRFGNVLVQTHNGDSLGSLEHYAQDWNNADMSEVTSGLNEAREPIVAPTGPMLLINHLLRMKKAVKAMDNAWFDTNKAVVNCSQSRKELYQNLLWEHHELSTAHKALFAAFEKANADKQDLAQVAELVERLNSLQRDKEKIEAQMSQLKEQHDVDFKREKDEDEIAKAKEDMEREKKDAVNEITSKFEKEVARPKEITDTERKLNELQKEQVALLNSKMKHWTTYTGKLNEDMAETFPESERHAVKAVQEARKGLTEPLEPFMTTMEDHIIAMAARVSHMKVLGVDLLDASLKAFSALYPTEPRPNEVSDLCEWLNASDIQLNEWRCSAGHAGEDQALKFVLSWYEDLDLDALATLRIDSAALSDEERI